MNYTINVDDLPNDIVRLFNLRRETRFRGGDAYIVYAGHLNHKFVMLQLINRLNIFFATFDSALAVSVDEDSNSIKFYPVSL